DYSCQSADGDFNWVF
nr:immunoglobulin light chain junction region [Macaca mulatta]MOX33342.1 immunoglobulin light chain junction region [Macaca mulatta]MOX33751.1 immunoglobulin light chain junction region [Macaca mulatta]MOX33919.1 immunoglobulin light chain junction region [Macaca mulatta]MOX34001.1 immunoglobulin light chain junction region [Macaca mulatta]